MSTNNKKLGAHHMLALIAMLGAQLPTRAMPEIVRFLSGPVDEPVTGPVSIIDTQHIWVGLTHTANGGRTWTARYPTKEAAGEFLNIPAYGQTTYFISDGRGWVSGINSVWVTTNGGDSWQPQMPGHIRAVSFVAENGWMAVSNNERFSHHVSNYTTSDLGQSWKTCGATWDSSTVSPLSSASFIDKGDGWITVARFDQFERPSHVGVAKTSDGGCTWKVVWWDSEEFQGENLSGIQFVDKENGWLFSSHGRLLETSDSGDHWRPVPLPTPHYNLESAYLAGKGKGWVLGSSMGGLSISFTSDGGQHWKALPNTGENQSTASEPPYSWGDAFFARLSGRSR